MKERRVFGPPGTGKTTRLATYLIPEAAAKYGPENVMVCSFTRAAAQEIATKPARFTTEFITEGDTIPIPDSNVGTLHSICFRAMQNPKILETEKGLIRQWNEQYKDMTVSGRSVRSFDEVYAEDSAKDGEGHGDRMLSALNIKRNRMFLDKRLWQMDLRRFEERWDKFKEENGCFDFTDLIWHCLKNVPYAPGRPKVIFVDEAQDMTKLQLTLVRGWAEDMEELYLVGDDDQCIYSFAGATHDAFLDPPIPDEDKIILRQSYRVPRLVLERANDLIKRVARRESKDYQARCDGEGCPIEGSVREVSATFQRPDLLIDEAAELAKANKTVMFLASCSYMLETIKKLLRDRGLPFENRYRRTRPDWNPLYSPPGKNGRIGTIELIENFIDLGEDPPYWTVDSFVKWVQHVKVGETGVIRKKGKKVIDFLKQKLETVDPSLFTTRNILKEVLMPAACEKALARDVTWLREHLTTDRVNDKFNYALKVAEEHGMAAVFERPRILIGTIHSVKGGQADHVYLFPDVSWQADAEIQAHRDGHDRSCRIFYVGMTRAREELILCSPMVKRNYQNPRMYLPL